MRKNASLLLCMTTFALLAGCSGSVPFSEDWQYLSSNGGAPGVVSRPDSPIADVPVPIGFSPLVEQSRAEVQGNVRVVKHVYQGRAKVQDVVDLYRRSLPLSGWTFTNEGNESDEYVLYYTKGPEALRVATRKKGLVVTITVNIGAREQRAFPPAQPTIDRNPNVYLGGVG